MTVSSRKITRFWSDFKEDWAKADISSLLLKFLKIEIWFFRQVFLNSWLFDFENRGIVRFVKKAAAVLPEGAGVLDAGAGDKPYVGFFKHCHYESCDYPASALEPGWHNFYCDLCKAIPQPEATYDAVISTQVLEHLPDPLQALREFHRVLKSGGTLYLTAPQGAPLHEEPHHYFNFTTYGLRLLCKQAGFKEIAIEPRGGYFHVLGYRCMHLCYTLGNQKDLKVTAIISLVLLQPLVQPVLGFLIPVLCLLLDPLDYERKFTLGYQVTCKK